MAFRSTARLLALAIFAAGPTSAQVVVITQSKALAGNVTPHDAAGYPISITQPGRYSLGSNLLVTGTKNGILVTANNVTIDFAGFVLDGNGQGYNGVQSDRDALTIRNGTIQQFRAAGIFAAESGISISDNWEIESMRITKNSGGGIRASIGVIDVRSNQITFNGSYGVSAGVAHIENNNISANGRGIVVGSGVVLGNTLYGNDFEALHANGLTGFGNNFIDGKVSGPLIPMQPNACTSACP